MPSSKFLRWGATSLARTRAAGKFAIQQVAHLGKASSSIPWFPYGFDANVPTNVLSILFGRDSKAHLPGTPPTQVPETESGEVVVFHPTSGSKVHFLKDGSILVEAGLASITVTATGGITLNPGGTPVTVNGDLVVTGSITANSAVIVAGATVGTTLAVTGATTLGTAVTSGGTNIGQSHTHVGSPTAPDGAQSNTGAPV